MTLTGKKGEKNNSILRNLLCRTMTTLQCAYTQMYVMQSNEFVWNQPHTWVRNYNFSVFFFWYNETNLFNFFTSFFCEEKKVLNITKKCIVISMRSSFCWIVSIILSPYMKTSTLTHVQLSTRCGYCISFYFFYISSTVQQSAAFFFLFFMRAYLHYGSL